MNCSISIQWNARYNTVEENRHEKMSTLYCMVKNQSSKWDIEHDPILVLSTYKNWHLLNFLYEQITWGRHWAKGYTRIILYKGQSYDVGGYPIFFTEEETETNESVSLKWDNWDTDLYMLDSRVQTLYSDTLSMPVLNRKKVKECGDQDANS
jgi:hypothetical protein